jgi:hypothetical protein
MAQLHVVRCYVCKRRLVVDVNSFFGFLHRVEVGDVADFSDPYAASTFRVEVRMRACVCSSGGITMGYGLEGREF